MDLVRDHFAAANELDFERAVAQFSEDVELVVHPDAFLDEGRFQGLEAVRRWFGNWFATFEPGYHFEIDEVRDLGDVVYMFAHHRGRGRSSGAEVSGQTAYLYTVREGTITRAELYSTPAEALEAAGVEE